MELNSKYPRAIDNRYKIISILGRGGMATTYKAIDLNTATEVVLKIISLRQARDWKVIELFEREAEILASLDHPFIPKYLNYFELDTDSDRFFCLVQDLVPGKSLFKLVRQNWQYNETTVREIAQKALEILQYLHGLTPPVIHRDIKPENIIRKADGTVYLVDFGSVQSVYRNPHSYIDTFVGTPGYMPPEQFSGKTHPGSDLYSLGCTLLFLLTKRLPTELPIHRLKIDFRSQINISKEFANWLDKILEPVIEDRFQSAQEALMSLPLSQKISLKVPTKTAKKIEIKQLNSKVFLIERGNILFINGLDSQYFYPRSLKIEGEIFTLNLGSSEFQHQVQGQTSILAVSTVKKQFGTRHQNIYCTIYDGTYFYNFGSELNSIQQAEIVERIADFIKNQYTQSLTKD